MHQLMASALYYQECHFIIQYSTLKHTVLGEYVIHIFYFVTVTCNYVDVLNLQECWFMHFYSQTL